MIAADKNLLQATLTQGVLSIQFQLVDLYTNNLTAIGTVCALVAGFAYTGYGEAAYSFVNKGDNILAYFYYPADLLALSLGLFAVAHTTIATMFGPAMALNGETPEMVIKAVEHMSDCQTYVCQIGVLCVSALLLSGCILGWARLPRGVAAMNTIVYASVGYVIYREGMKAYILFKHDDKGLRVANLFISLFIPFRDGLIRIKGGALGGCCQVQGPRRRHVPPFFRCCR